MRFESFLRSLDMGACEDQLQRETLLELALLFVAIDGEVADSEMAFINDWLAGVPWKSDTNKESYLQQALAKCQSAILENDIEHFIAHRAGLLQDKCFKEQALDMAEAIANADGQVDPSELDAINKLKNYLQ